MDAINIGNKLLTNLKKFRFPLLILLLGILLMTLPGKQNETPAAKAPSVQVVKEDPSARLEEILSCIHGAGKLKLYLSVAEGERTNYQVNEDIRADGETSDIHRDTVIITGSDRTESGLISQIDPPKYLGAVVVCQGADSAAVRLAIVDAVSKATGLGSDKITVLKMK